MPARRAPAFFLAMIETGLRDKVVALTGANNPRGIGAATARAFAAQGARLFLHQYRQPLPQDAGAATDVPGDTLYRAAQAASADDIAKAIRAGGGTAHTWEADFGEPRSVPKLFDEAEAVLGPIDVLVNNAAHSEKDSFEPEQGRSGDPLSELAQSHDRHFAVNSRAVALLMAEFARRYAKREGRIINVSTDGSSGHAGAVSYGASKHALESYSRAAAYELGPLGITVNVVAPGPVQTGWISPEFEAELVAAIPLRRLGRPEDIADVIVFLASDQARWITGQTLYVGGGNVMPL